MDMNYVLNAQHQSPAAIIKGLSQGAVVTGRVRIPPSMGPVDADETRNPLHN